MNDIVFILLLSVGMLGTSAFFKQWRLFFVFLIFFIIFGLCEWLSITQTGLSISQHFWRFDESNPVGGWIVIVGMLLSWLSLLAHFKWRKK